MGINAVGPSSEKGDAREVDDVNVQTSKLLESSVPGLDSDCLRVGESSRGSGSASLLEVLWTQRVTRLSIPAARASQGAYECLWPDIARDKL